MTNVWIEKNSCGKKRLLIFMRNCHFLRRFCFFLVNYDYKIVLEYVQFSSFAINSRNCSTSIKFFLSISDNSFILLLRIWSFMCRGWNCDGFRGSTTKLMKSSAFLLSWNFKRSMNLKKCGRFAIDRLNTALNDSIEEFVCIFRRKTEIELWEFWKTAKHIEKFSEK